MTEKGDLVYRAAQRLFASVREFSDTLDGSRKKLIGNLPIAIIDNWVFNQASPFSSALKKFVDIAPDVSIELFSLAPDDIEVSVQDSRVSFGVGVFHRHKPGLIYETVGFEKIGLYCARGHPLYDERDPSKVQAVLKTSRYAKRAYLKERDVSPISRGLQTYAHAHQIEGIAHLILTGRYIGYLPKQLADVWIREGKMRSVGAGQFDQLSELELVKKRGADITMVAETFEKLIWNFSTHKKLVPATLDPTISCKSLDHK